MISSQKQPLIRNMRNNGHNKSKSIGHLYNFSFVMSFIHNRIIMTENYQAATALSLDKAVPTINSFCNPNTCIKQHTSYYRSSKTTFSYNEQK